MKARVSRWPITILNDRASTGSIVARVIARKLSVSQALTVACGIDAPARSHGTELTDLVKHAETIVVPVLPSTIDMQATTTFLAELRNVHKISSKQAKFGLVANRVRDNTLIFDDLDEYLTKAKAPYIAALREAQNYVRAYTRGLGIFELPEYLAWPDWDEWEPLTAWLRSKRSQP
jgi:chromosome partitioning protein